MKKIYDVVIVGGGPTGIALGLELGLNNINALIIEKYNTPLLSPRAQSLNPRSMEFFLRWKIARKLAEKQLLPPDFPPRGIYCSKLNGKTYATSGLSDQLTDEMTPERDVRVPLWITEEVLRERLKDFSSIDFLKPLAVTDVNFQKEYIQITAKHLNKEKNFQAKYVVACDGANSITRERAGIEFEALAPPQRFISILFESFELEKLITVDKGFVFFMLGSAQPGATGPVDLTRGLWYAQIRNKDGVETIEQINLEKLLDDMVGFPFNKKIVKAHFWDIHIQVAKQFSAQESCVFLVGDSAHAFTPQGGFGLNTGFSDVVNLGWKLSAVIKNEAPISLLATYEKERLPIVLKNLAVAQKNTDGMLTLRKKFNPAEDPEGFAKANVDLAKEHFHSLGLTMGYAYFDSELTVLQKNQSLEPMSTSVYKPEVAPGYFLPHRWVEKNKSIYEVLSPTSWTLIICGENNISLLDEFKKFNFEILSFKKDFYPYHFILLRPDWHIAFVTDQLTEKYLNFLRKIFWQ